VEFLPDELVEYDVDEFVPDEFVLDEGATESSVGSVGFAGPSDAPPPYRSMHPLVIRSSRADAGAGHRARRSIRSGWIAVALAGVAGLVAMALVNRPPPVQPAAPGSVVSAAPPSDTAVAPAPVSPLAEAERPAVAALADAGDHEGVDAMDLKHRAQQALEKGKLGPALDLGQQAVDADPSDAESWLILGATYLQRSKYGDARRCFARCVDQATRGPVGECRALLR
jgi:Flp pilus assembly protein TadD